MSTEKKLPFQRLIVAGVLLSVLLLVLFSASLAFAKSTPPSPKTWHAQVGAESKDMSIQGMAFLPGELWINAGDTVVWTIKSAEIHTITFLKPGQTLPPFNTQDPLQALKQGANTYEGTSYHNSGLMSNLAIPGVPAAQTYTLTFIATGDFTYHCFLHPSMVGVVHVRPVGTSYPYSPWGYNRQIIQGMGGLLHDGNTLTRQAEQGSSKHYVTAGIGDNQVTVMRFFPKHVTIHRGESITFVNSDSMEPHTVTFGPAQATDFVPYGNPHAFDGQSPLNSGFLGLDPHWHGTTFTVTFTKVGSYAFRCDLYDYLGMEMMINVIK